VLRRIEGGYIGVSRGSVLPFYPNVISAKYENSYVAALYISEPPLSVTLIRASPRVNADTKCGIAERGQRLASK
jgi:hypothetical protein